MNNITEPIAMGGHAGAFEEVLGLMINRSIQTGIMEKKDVVVLLEDMIQQVERGTLDTILNYT